MGELSKSEHARKYLWPIAILFFIWVFVGNMVEYNYKKQNLNWTKGKVVYIEQVTTEYYKKADDDRHELIIRLENSPADFIVRDIFDYRNVINTIKIGDTIVIYSRKKYQVIFGFGKLNEICQIEYKDNIIFDITQRKRNALGLAIISLSAIILFTSLYFFFKKSRKIV